MPKLNLSARPATSGVIQGRMKLAHLMTMSEAESEDLARRLEAAPLFGHLAAAGVVTLAEFPGARFAARRFAGYGLRLSGGGLPELVDGNCDLVRLIQRVGQERFEEWYLGAEASSDEERARGCGISVGEARKLREFMDRAFIAGEFEGPAAPAPETVFSAVAGIEIAAGAPVLAFFHRDVWKKRYLVDKDKLGAYLRATPAAEEGEVRQLLSRLELLEQRKSTLYRLLEEILALQAEYLRTGEPARRRPLAQKAVAAKLGVDPSVLNRLISNKSVQLPWGLEAPLATFFPSAKDINRERLCVLAEANPGLTDAALAREMERLYEVRLSRRSIAQYRKELALVGPRRRSDGSVSEIRV